MIIDYEALRQALGRIPHAADEVPSDFEKDAVCLLLFDGDETNLLAVQKADNEGYFWRDQVALPGGRIELDDRSAQDAALRELHEELSIRPSEVEVLGDLGNFRLFSSKNDIEVVVGRWIQPSGLGVDCREIKRVLELPLDRLAELHVDGGFRSRPASEIADALVYPLSDARIWGVTARILHAFLELVLHCGILGPNSR